MSYTSLTTMTFEEFEYFYYMEIPLDGYHIHEKRPVSILYGHKFIDDTWLKPGRLQICKNFTTIWIADQPKREWKVPSPSRNSSIW